jgi:hypothetical protein
MPSLIESLVNRVQAAATPDAPLPFSGSSASPAPRMPGVLVPPTPASSSNIIRRRLNTIDPQGTTIPNDMFKDMLDVIDRQPEKSRKGRAGYLHVSALIGLCSRAQVLSVLHGIDIYQQVTGAHRVMWKFGRAVEQHVRDNIIEAKKYADAYGVWKCVCKRTEQTGYFPHNVRCPMCKGKLDNYHELTLFDHEAGIVGNPDLLMRHGLPFLPIEVKSITGEDFKDLTQPQGDHIFQAAMYRHLLVRNDMPAYDEVVIFYTSKHFRWGSPYKEFHVDVTTPQITRLVEDAVAQAREVKLGNAQRLVPTRTVCADNTCTRAKNCPAQNLCFQLP